MAKRRGEAGGAREVVTGRPRSLNAVVVVEYAQGERRHAGVQARGAGETSRLLA